jgi:hypothetical protein
MKTTATGFGSDAAKNSRNRLSGILPNRFQGGSLNQIVEQAGTTKGSFIISKARMSSVMPVVDEIIQPPSKQGGSIRLQIPSIRLPTSSTPCDSL